MVGKFELSLILLVQKHKDNKRFMSSHAQTEVWESNFSFRAFGGVNRKNLIPKSALKCSKKDFHNEDISMILCYLPELSLCASFMCC